MPDSSQAFLRELDKKLWTAAARLRSNLDAAVSSRAERDRRVRRPARDYCIEKNISRVPPVTRTKTRQDSANLPDGTEIKERGRLVHSFKITSLGKPADDALEAMKKENPNGAEQTGFWLEMLRDISHHRRLKLEAQASQELARLLDEATQLVAITVASRKTARGSK